MMWSQTVTRYRLTGGKVEVKTFHNCHYEYEMEEIEDARGRRREGLARLFIIGDGDVSVGDRVAEGGPLALPWEQLLPGLVPGLCQIDHVKKWVLGGTVHHTEAGRSHGPEGR